MQASGSQGDGQGSMSGASLGRYRLKERLGQGGMATVYRAEDPSLKRDVAIKVMHPFIAERREASERFAREARAVAGLRHPSVLQLHDYAPATADHPAYLVMELLTGPSLKRFIDDHGTPLAEMGAIIAHAIARALAAAHARGIVHRDVKPENVMFDLAPAAVGEGDEGQPRAARVVLCDFGVARWALEDQTGMTATGAIIGSPAYMSPEQAAGSEVDARSDQFSLGALLYQLTTGGLPFVGTQPLVVLAKIAAGVHAPPGSKNPRVPPYLERVIERCLKVDPAARFPSAEACAEALREGLAQDGFLRLDQELEDYLRDPPGWNAKAGPRIVQVALDQAARAAAAGQVAQALGACGRVLAWDTANASALALMRRLGRRSGVRRALLLAGAAALGLAGAAVYVRHATRRAVQVPSGAPAAVIAGSGRTPLREPVPSPASRPPSLERKHVRVAHTSPGSAVASAPRVAASAPLEPPTALPPPSEQTPAATVAPVTEAELSVAIAPWCDLTVDGAARGRTPQRVTLPPGRHHLSCVNPVSGAQLSREVTLEAGEHREVREHLYTPARVTATLRRGDAFSIDGDPPAAASRTVEPGRRRVTLYASGRVLETRYLDIRPGGCALSDAPELQCVKP